MNFVYSTDFNGFMDVDVDPEFLRNSNQDRMFKNMTIAERVKTPKNLSNQRRGQKESRFVNFFIFNF